MSNWRSHVFLSTAVAIIVLLVACSGLPQGPTGTPTTPLPQPFPAGPIPRQTPSENAAVSSEVVDLPWIVLDEEKFEGGLAGIASQESVDHRGDRERPAQETFEDQLAYASEVWEQEMKAEESSDSVFALKILLAYAQKDGADKTAVSFEESYPKLKDVHFYRFQLDRLPSSKDEEMLYAGEPLAITLRKGTSITVIGTFVHNGVESSLVSFSESFDRSQTGVAAREVPRQYLAIIPEKRQSGATKNLVSLESLVSLAGGSYNDGKIKFNKDGKTYIWPISVVGPDLVKKVKDEVGSFWMDQKPNGEWYANPVVPRVPDEISAFKGQVAIGQGETVNYEDKQANKIAEATYNEARRVWEWRLLVKPTPTATITPTPEPTREPTKIPTKVPSTPKPEPTPVPQVPTPEPPKPQPTSTPERVNNPYVDVLDMPGWLASQSVTKQGDGSLRIETETGTSEVIWRNRTDALNVNSRGFEVVVKMSAVSYVDPSVGKNAAIMLIDRNVSYGANWLRVGISAQGGLSVMHRNESQNLNTVIANTFSNIRLSSNEVKIEVLGSGSNEVFNFYDAVTGRLVLGGVELPVPFFSRENSNLYFGMYPQAGDKNGVVMTISKFLARSY